MCPENCKFILKNKLKFSDESINDLVTFKDILLNYNNVFSLNRIGTGSEVEGGESLSLGLEFKRE